MGTVSANTTESRAAWASGDRGVRAGGGEGEGDEAEAVVEAGSEAEVGGMVALSVAGVVDTCTGADCVTALLGVAKVNTEDEVALAAEAEDCGPTGVLDCTSALCVGVGRAAGTWLCTGDALVVVLVVVVVVVVVAG